MYPSVATQKNKKKKLLFVFILTHWKIHTKYFMNSVEIKEVEDVEKSPLDVLNALIIQRIIDDLNYYYTHRDPKIGIAEIIVTIKEFGRLQRIWTSGKSDHDSRKITPSKGLDTWVE